MSWLWLFQPYSVILSYNPLNTSHSFPTAQCIEPPLCEENTRWWSFCLLLVNHIDTDNDDSVNNLWRAISHNIFTWCFSFWIHAKIICFIVPIIGVFEPATLMIFSVSSKFGHFSVAGFVGERRAVRDCVILLCCGVRWLYNTYIFENHTSPLWVVWSELKILASIWTLTISDFLA